MRANITRVIRGEPLAFTQGLELINHVPEAGRIRTAVCAYMFGLAIKAITNSNQAAENALRSMGHHLSRVQHGGIIHDLYQTTDLFAEALLGLIQQGYFLRYVLVLMYLSLVHTTGAPWISMVVRIRKYVEDAGVAVYAQIRDHLVSPQAAPLALEVFGSNLVAFEQALDHAEALGVFAPFVRFLDMPQAGYFEAGRFPSLILFMRGYFGVRLPDFHDLIVGQVYENRRLRWLGRIWGNLVISSISQIPRVKLGLGPEALEAVSQLRDRYHDKQDDDDSDQGEVEYDF